MRSQFLMTRNVFQLLNPQFSFWAKIGHFGRVLPYQKLHFEPNFVISDKVYPIKHLHLEPNSVILNSIMYFIKNLHFLVKFWVQNHHSKHEIDSPDDCKSLCFFLTFFYHFLSFFKKIISQLHDFKLSLMLHAFGVLTRLY